jgi:hypothetical protein
LSMILKDEAIVAASLSVCVADDGRGRECMVGSQCG